MQNFELTPEEMDVLRELVQHAANELDVEIHRTDRPAFKDQLKTRRSVVENLQAKLNSMPALA